MMPTMLRRWQRKLHMSDAPPVSAMASPADQASGIAQLQRELDRAWMKRDILKKAVGIPSTSLRTGCAEMPR
jgi:transposase